jgi:methionyl-tRNA synthetase
MFFLYLQAMKKKSFKRFTITAALPYANGPVHIGHLAGVYVPSDIYVRYLRSVNKEVLFVCGSDEHGVPITISAQKEGVSPQAIVDKYHAQIRDSFADFGISFDIYSRTSAKVHHETSSEFFKKLDADGNFIQKESEQFFDAEANQFLADRYIKGNCPKCGYEDAYGDQCEKCGTSLSPAELINPRSMLSGNKPVLKMTKHWYLPLDKYEPWLKEWILDDHKDWKTNVYGQCKSWLDQGLQARAVTRDLDWGVPVPAGGAEGKVLYVWFDAPIGYISATKDWAQQNNTDWEPFWKSEDTKLVHFIGKDNIVFHCIIFPCMLKAHGEYILPDQVPANEFLNLEGNKISTSRNWAVWLHEYLSDFEGKQDVLRYVLTANAPETKDNDFTWKDYQQRNNSELVAVLGNFINRSMVLTQKFFEAKVPACGELSAEDKLVIEELSQFPNRIAASIEEFRFREALGILMDLARLGNKYLAENEPWKTIKTNPVRTATVLNISNQVVANLAILAEPFLPFTSAKVFQMLNLKRMTWNEAGSSTIVSEAHELAESALLFDKIEDEAIQKQMDKLEATKQKNQITEHKHIAVKEVINYEQFAGMDMRIGTVVQAEAVPKSNKLLKLLIDTGVDKRTILSGIAHHFKPEDVIGQQVVVLLNLAPRKMMGMESEGMVLMAEDANGKLHFIRTPDKVPSGATIS